MKKLLKSLRSRLCDSMKVLLSDRYFLYCTPGRHPSDKGLFFEAAFVALKRYLPLVCEETDSAEARLDMLTAVLTADNSVVLIAKEHGQCLASYDCQSQADFDELLNQEVL